MTLTPKTINKLIEQIKQPYGGEGIYIAKHIKRCSRFVKTMRRPHCVRLSEIHRHSLSCPCVHLKRRMRLKKVFAIRVCQRGLA